MYNKYRSRSSFRGNNQNSSFNKPSNTSRFNQPRRGRGQSQLGKDPSIFIKKATFTTEAVTYTAHNNFADFQIHDLIKQNITAHGYTSPTPIQDQAIAPILQGRDLIGLANTGTGKTAAFLIPLIDKTFKDRNQKVLIVAPTRELATQINQEFRNFRNGTNLYSALLIGGAGIHRQISDIRRNPNFVIATPGRLKDLIERNIIHLEDYSSFVLDEVDLMVDIGFIQDVQYFISLLPRVRQSLFFSATMPTKVQGLVQSFVNNPVTISVIQQPTAENVDQDIIKVKSHDEKVEQLHELLISDGFDKVLVFGRTKHGIEKLNKQLLGRGFKVGSIHGNKSQGQRQRALDSFKRSETQILLATDVASRGLDIDNVTHVINYDLPETFEDYIHRIGRTGRADKKGSALTFVD